MTTFSAIDHDALFDAIPTSLMILDRNLCFVAASNCYLKSVDRDRADVIGRHVFDAFPENREREAIMHAAFTRALAGEDNECERQRFDITQPDGNFRDAWWTTQQIPVRDKTCAITGVLQHVTDVTAEVVSERLREAISQEYDHRVRNILTKVSAIVRRTARNSRTVEEFVDDFEPRISAMARAHKLLVHGGWETLGLADLLDGELRPYASRSEGQIGLVGPNVTLSSRVAQALGMAVHELATNALKYGALSVPAGRLAVTWQVTAGALRLNWTETGLTGLVIPQSNGFGSTIIDRILPAETAGSVTRRFAPTGLVCTIEVPKV